MAWGRILRVQPWLIGAAVAAQVLTLLWLVWERTPRVPYSDEWETVDLVRKAAQGTLGAGDFWTPHNQHRIVIPRLIDLAIIEITHWNRQVEMSFDLLLALGAGLLLLLALRKTVRIQTWSIWLTVPLALLLLSFSQFENWLLPFQVSFTATTFGLACMVYALATSSVGLRAFLLAAAGALIASLSNLDGLLLWIVFFPAILRAGRHWALAWAALAIAVIVPYFVGFENASTSVKPLAMFGYTLAYLGAPVGFPSLLPSQLAGAVSIALLLLNLWVYRHLRGAIAPIVIWIGLAGFALVCAVTTAAGRAAQLGSAQAMSSRYQAFAALWWVALVVLGWLTAQRLLNTSSSGNRRFPRLSLGALLINGVALGLTCLGLARANVTGFHDASTWLDAERYDQQCIVQFRSAADSCLALYYPDPNEVRRKAAILEHEHMAIFAGNAGSTSYVEYAIQEHSCNRWRGVRGVKPCDLVSESPPGRTCHSC